MRRSRRLFRFPAVRDMEHDSALAVAFPFAGIDQVRWDRLGGRAFKRGDALTAFKLLEVLLPFPAGEWRNLFELHERTWLSRSRDVEPSVRWDSAW